MCGRCSFDEAVGLVSRISGDWLRREWAPGTLCFQ